MKKFNSFLNLFEYIINLKYLKNLEIFTKQY